jgi:hypothetical protein
MSFTGQAVDDALLSKVSNKVGTVVQSMLEELEFNNENPGTWKLMNGQSCAASEYQTLTGNSIVPDVVTNGEFIRQAKPGRSIGTLEGDDNKSHDHQIMGDLGVAVSDVVGGSGANYGLVKNGAYPGSYTQDRGSSEAKPKNIAMNHFIKTDY